MRALVIDDSKAVRSIIRRILADCGFREILEAGHGKEALEVISQHGVPDLSVVDWSMPVMDGLTFVRAVRGFPEAAPMSILMVTTETERPRIVGALAAGANEYLTKPFTKEAMVEKLGILGFGVNA
ncbi:MAG: response regulator [Planctomycetes bacterium]|nr:response regulator [Planctomycetota bacterium]